MTIVAIPEGDFNPVGVDVWESFAEMKPPKRRVSPKSFDFWQSFTEMKVDSGLTRRQARLLRMMARDGERLSAAMQPRSSKIFSALGKKASRAYSLTVEGKAAPYVGAISDLVAMVMGLMGLDQFQSDNVVPLWKAHYKLTAEVTFMTIAEALQLTGGASPDEEGIATRILETGGRRAGLIDLSGDTKRAMFKAIEVGRVGGESNDQIARRIEAEVTAGRYNDVATRAQVISRTETKFAQVSASIEIYRDNPNVSGIQLIDAQLGPTDEECTARNGRIVTPDEAQAALDSEHPNGSLAVIAVVR